jgi:beta-glucosidase
MKQNRKYRWALVSAINLVGGTIVLACGLTDHLYVPMNPGAAGSSSGSGGVGSGSGGSPGSSGGSQPGSPGHYSDDGGSTVVVVNLDAGAPDVAKIACTDSVYSDPWSPGYQEDPSVLPKAQAIVSSMTLTEQANQLRGTNPNGNQNYDDIFRTPPDTTKNVNGFFFRDGPRGVCVSAAKYPSVSSPPDAYSTAFPGASSRGAAFDMDLEYQIGAGIADETLASGNTMLLAPVINLLRHPAWGRSQETYGEDTFELGRLGTAFASGAQQYIPVCAKHYAAYDIEDGRESLNATLDEQTLREFYTRHFGAVIRDAGVGCIMASYNLVNGTKSTLSNHLLTDILRGDIGFKGFVLSDWWALPPGTASTTTDALQATAAAGLTAQMDMELPWTYNYAEIEAVTGAGQPLSPNQVQTSATRVVEQKIRFQVDGSSNMLGLKAPVTTYDSINGIIGNNSANIALSQRAALESMVLLKNDNNTLPIQRSKVKTVAVIGASVPFSTPGTSPASGTVNFATDVRLGDLGSSRVFSDPAKSIGPFAGIQTAAGSGITVVSGTSASAAANADFVVVIAGLTPQDEGEEYTGAGDRACFELDGKITPACDGSGPQDTLINQVAALNKPMAVVLEGGSVINMPWLSKVPAVVMAWYPGMVGGTPLGQMLFGDASFSGKLPVTWPVQWSDEPAFNSGTTTNFNYYTGYHYFDQNGITPLFPFGAGLSYTTFQYENLQVPCSSVTDNGVVQVKADVTNTGAMAADEVTFLFISWQNSTIRHPAKELKGFIRETIQPGQTVEVTIPLRISDLVYFDTNSNAWKPESGTVKIMVGGSSANLPLTDTLTIQ